MLHGAQKSSSSRSIFSKLIGSLFFLVFGLLGLFFLYLMVSDSLSMLRSRTWPIHRCSIISSAVFDSGNDNDPYVLEVAYRYEIGGRSYERSSPNLKSGSDMAEIQQAKEKYAPGAIVPCQINPQNGEQVVLEQRSLWNLLAALIPLPFILVGFGGIYILWRDPGATTLKRSSRAGGGKIALRFLALILLAAGAALAYFLSIRPLQGMLEAKQWKAIRCQVVSSTVRTHPGDSDSGPTYNADVLYSYEINGKRYESNRFSFMSGSSSGYKHHQAIAEKYSPGTAFTCFVDPDNPSDAVIDRGFRPVYLLGLIGAVLFIAGLGVFALSGKLSPVPALNESGKTAATAGGFAAAAPMRQKSSRVGRLIGAISAALIWNGIVSVFVWLAYRERVAGEANWFLEVFLLLFVLVGLALILGTVHTFLALLNPRASLMLATSSIRLGELTRVRWRIDGRVDKLRKLRIALSGIEQATYRRGTSTHTSSSYFYKKTLVETDVPSQMSMGEISLLIPQDSMHSFKAPSNRIEWVLTITGEIPHWPDTVEEYELNVLPARQREF